MRTSEIDTPAVLIDAEILERNIRRAAEQCGKHRIALRPHIKTHKMPPLARMQVAAGAVGLAVAKRERALREENGRVNRLLDRIEGEGLRPEVVSGASTPNLDLCHLLERVNENRSGTYVFNDRNTVSTGSVGWEDCALRIAVTVVSA